jgi:hypothetical protein
LHSSEVVVAADCSEPAAADSFGRIDLASVQIVVVAASVACWEETGSAVDIHTVQRIAQLLAGGIGHIALLASVDTADLDQDTACLAFAGDIAAAYLHKVDSDLGTVKRIIIIFLFCFQISS